MCFKNAEALVTSKGFLLTQSGIVARECSGLEDAAVAWGMGRKLLGGKSQELLKEDTVMNKTPDVEMLVDLNEDTPDPNPNRRTCYTHKWLAHPSNRRLGQVS